MGSVKKQCILLGLTSNLDDWSDKDINWLKNNYQKLSAKACAEYLNRTIGAVQAKVSVLKLNKCCNIHYWSADEIIWLKENSKIHSLKYCADYLNRSVWAVKSKLHRL